MVEIHKRDLPAGLKERNVIRSTDGTYVFDEVETERIRKETKAMFDKMWEKIRKIENVLSVTHL